MRTRLRIGPENLNADSFIPPGKPDNSGIGANYAEEYLKALNVPLENGARLKAKRKGLKVLLTLGDKTGEGLMRKREDGPDVRLILRRALAEAAAGLGGEFVVEEGVMYLDLKPYA
jgi:hypothetical protein